MTTAKPQTRTYSPREQNKRVVQATIEAHATVPTTVGGVMVYCNCKSREPRSAMDKRQWQEHLAEQIVQAQNEWVRSL
jgi:hypothetical protein